MAAAWVYLGVMSRFRISLLAAVLAAVLAAQFAAVLAVPAQAGGRTVVIELFTSQGCSSCPPADEALARLAGRDDVIPLSLHVDYWDYLGWRDTFAQRQFGHRQQAYRDALGERVVFTPQLVVHGGASVRVSGLEAAIAQAGSGPAPVTMSIEPHEGMLICRIDPVAGPVSGTIWIAKYSLSETVEIARGENAGRSAIYRNVVTMLSRFGDWSGDEHDEYPVPQPEPGEGVAVWLQEGEAGPILAATRVENPAR